MGVVILGEERLNRKLNVLAGGGPYRSALQETAEHMKRQAQTCPPQRRQPQPFKTEKQRRFFFAALKSGEITVPHQRREGGGLAGGWTIVGGGLTVSVINVVPGGQYVMGTRMQSAYHRGNWKTERDLSDEAGPFLTNATARKVRQAWDAT